MDRYQDSTPRPTEPYITYPDSRPKVVVLINSVYDNDSKRADELAVYLTSGYTLATTVVTIVGTYDLPQFVDTLVLN